MFVPKFFNPDGFEGRETLSEVLSVERFEDVCEFEEKEVILLEGGHEVG